MTDLVDTLFQTMVTQRLLSKTGGNKKHRTLRKKRVRESGNAKIY